MDVTRAHTYAATIDQVIAMLRLPDVTVEKYQSMGHRDIEILDCVGDDTSLRVESSRVVDVEVPGFAKKILRPTNTMVQVDQWRATPDGEWDGIFEVDVQGSPVQLSGTMHLSPAPAGCTEEISVSVSVRIPLIGGKIADWAAKNDVQRSIDAEFAFGDKWLAANPG